MTHQAITLCVLQSEVSSMPMAATQPSMKPQPNRICFSSRSGGSTTSPQLERDLLRGSRLPVSAISEHLQGLFRTVVGYEQLYTRRAALHA